MLDPNGAPTSGIVRRRTGKRQFSTATDDVMFDAYGGSDAWPPADYLNFWICPNLGSANGYRGQPRRRPGNRDGVVITAFSVAKPATARSPAVRGRTATHEVGHWLNLLHISGDDQGSCRGAGDLVADTPNNAAPIAGHPTFPHVSCSNGPDGDMFMNYMDLTDGTCTVMFTRGQAQRMQDCLDGIRSTIGRRP